MMKICVQWLMILLLMAGSPLLLAYPYGSIHWNHRTILYFAPEKDQHVDSFLKESLMNDCLLKERDIMVFVMTKDGFNQPGDLLSPEEVRRLALKYNIDESSHTAILIGKDGKEKYRWRDTTNWQYLTQLIDSMPLRKEEIAAQTSSPCSI